jgi:type IV pilus assembly protein PilA
MKMDLMKKKKKKGFTLIELIVVIAILGILAAVAVPRFSGFTDKAKDAADKQYGALIGNAISTLKAEGTVTGSGSVLIAAADGTFTLVTGHGFTGLAANDSKVTDLVAPKKLAGTGTVTVEVSSEGVVKVTLD